MQTNTPHLKLRVVSNNQFRAIDEIEDENNIGQYVQAVKYKNTYFNLSDFIKIDESDYLRELGWHGVYPLNAFYSILINISPCGEMCVVGNIST